ncbi:MAG TPA: hypothetical protein VHE99_06940 [Gammaproteobacteria bacterium]|nr:hypothetical protein [Gammaproteobacteria bacterium]
MKSTDPIYDKYRRSAPVVKSMEERCNYLAYFCSQYARRYNAPSMEGYADCIIICAYKEIEHYQEVERFKKDLTAWRLPPPIIRKNACYRAFDDNSQEPVEEEKISNTYSTISCRYS